SEADGHLVDHLIVGDVKQSIYRWRNGDWRILHSKAKRNIGEPLVLDDNLQENYRSASNIIDFNNFLFKYSPEFLQTHLNNKVLEDGGEDLAAWWRSEGYHNIVTSAYQQSYQQKAPTTPKGGCIEISYLPVSDSRSRASETKEVALERLASKLNEWFSQESPAYQPGDICVLVRTNGEAREVIERLMQDQQLREYQSQQPGYDGPRFVPYQVMSGEALLIANNSAVRLLINTLHAMAGKRDQTALYKAIIIYFYNQQHNRSIDAQAWLNVNNTEPGDLKAYLPESLCANWETYQQLPLAELIEQLIASYQLDKIELNLPYLLAFRDLVSTFVKFGERGITSFLQWWEEEGERKALPSSEHSDAVQVMTIHKSKGLAFDVVMMPFCSWNLDGMANSIFWVNTHETPYAMLNTVPVHYKKTLSHSKFAKDYFEELLFNYMDALNMLYVATTRTRKHLYITAPASSGNEEQFSVAGDLIRKPLSLYAEELNASFEHGELIIQEPVLSARTTHSENGRPKEWSFHTYPISNRLNDALTDKKVWEQLDLLSGNTSQRRGIILHEVLARVNEIKDLPAAIKQMQTEGWFRKAEEPEILELAESVLLQSDLRNLLDKPYQSLSEQTIINSRGESYRPDKVLIGENQVLIIDFKFTGEPKPEHYKQVEEYRQLLLEMGYQNIEAYLYYGYLKELKAV
ncbi:MAG TPA: 3'-5' exonuclease, partial [Sphingobacteriaceae bacterium]